MSAKRTLIAVNALLVAMVACSLPAGRSPAQPPDLAGTITARAMALMQSSNVPPVLTPAPPSAAIPSPTPTLVLTPTASLPEASVSAAANCRAGPGSAYDVLDALQPGQTAQVIGRDSASGYWIIQMPGASACWLWGKYATVNGDVASIPEVPPPPTPTASLPADPTGLQLMFHCSLSSSPFLHNEVHVTIRWQDNASNETGYYVFRNGTLLASLAAGTDTFTDETTMTAFAPIGQPKPQITYSVQAFNASGRSAKISKSIGCF